jgi:hypothetical protein
LRLSVPIGEYASLYLGVIEAPLILQRMSEIGGVLSGYLSVIAGSA